MTARRPGGPPTAWGGEAGSAIVEFVVLAVVVLVPLLYLVLAVAEVQRNVFAVTQAAREAGRAYATAPDEVSAAARADYAARLAVGDQGLPPGGVGLTYVPAGAPCSAGGGAGSLRPGSRFVVCVTRPVLLPGVPGFLDARRNTVTGRFVVRVDDFRSP